MVVDFGVFMSKKQRNLLRLVSVTSFLTPVPKTQPTWPNIKKVWLRYQKLRHLLRKTHRYLAIRRLGCDKYLYDCLNCSCLRHPIDQSRRIIYQNRNRKLDCLHYFLFDFDCFGFFHGVDSQEVIRQFFQQNDWLLDAYCWDFLRGFRRQKLLRMVDVFVV